MTIRNMIEDGKGTGSVAQVTERNAVLVQLVPDTSIGIAGEILTALRLEREYFDNAGSPDLNQNGSVSPLDFEVRAELGFTKWITGFRINLEGVNFEIGTNDFRRFGAAAGPGGLTNGVEIFSLQSGEQINISLEPIKTSGDFLSYADRYINLVNSVGAQEDFLQFTFVLDKPIVLPDGSSDRIVIRVSDNLTAIDKFQAIAQGYKEGTS